MSDESLSPQHSLEQALQRTPARLLVGRVGSAYRTSTWLKLREDHAVARDAVADELNLETDFGVERITSLGLFQVQSQAKSKLEYLMRPDRGRRFDDASREKIRELCPQQPDLQVVVGDGLSSLAVRVHAPPLLDLLHMEAAKWGWTVGRPFLVHYCRVGILNDVGELLAPRAVVLLIGERPGLATAESLSAYLAYQPRLGHNDANRNLISNIHGFGVPHHAAVRRIFRLVDQFRQAGRSGVDIKELETSADLAPGRLN